MSATAKSAQRVILGPEMSFHEAYSHVLSGAVPYEAFEEWDADRIKRIEAKAKASAGARGDEWRGAKVSEKGCVSLGRIPGANAQFGCVMFVAALEYIFKHEEKIKAFIAENNGKLSRKAAA